MEACLKINSSDSKLDTDEKIIKILSLPLTFIHSFLFIHKHIPGLHIKTEDDSMYEASKSVKPLAVSL